MCVDKATDPMLTGISGIKLIPASCSPEGGEKKKESKLGYCTENSLYEGVLEKMWEYYGKKNMFWSWTLNNMHLSNYRDCLLMTCIN